MLSATQVWLGITLLLPLLTDRIVRLCDIGEALASQLQRSATQACSRPCLGSHCCSRHSLPLPALCTLRAEMMARLQLRVSPCWEARPQAVETGHPNNLPQVLSTESAREKPHSHWPFFLLPTNPGYYRLLVGGQWELLT